jgi:hypothetical protein
MLLFVGRSGCTDSPWLRNVLQFGRVTSYEIARLCRKIRAGEFGGADEIVVKLMTSQE